MIDKHQFTERQRAVVALIAQGKTNEEIGETLGIAPSTARMHTNVVRQKLGVAKRRMIPTAYTTATGEIAATISLPVAA